jgi:uncharacterized membrane protein YbaN (DUF454 family)
MRRWAWFALGWVAVAVGSIGLVLPVVPTTGPFVLAAACFARSSPRFERWVLGLPTIGPLVRDHRAGLGMPRRAKVLAIGSIVVACSVSAVTVGNPALAALVLALGAVGVWYVGWRVPTKESLPPEVLVAGTTPAPPAGWGGDRPGYAARRGDRAGDRAGREAPTD